jgi:hypothetical protein
MISIHSKQPADMWFKKAYIEKDMAYVNLQNYYVQKYGSLKQTKKVVEDKAANFDINPW